MALVRYWFFADGGRTLIAAADCGSADSARRLAQDYNRSGEAVKPVDLITNDKEPDLATVRMTVEPS